jgi:hypothetical protein
MESESWLSTDREKNRTIWSYPSRQASSLHISAICFQIIFNIVDQCCRNVFATYFYASFINIFRLFLTVLRVWSCIVLINYLRLNSFLHYD